MLSHLIWWLGIQSGDVIYLMITSKIRICNVWYPDVAFSLNPFYKALIYIYFGSSPNIWMVKLVINFIIWKLDTTNFSAAVNWQEGLIILFWSYWMQPLILCKQFLPWHLSLVELIFGFLISGQFWTPKMQMLSSAFINHGRLLFSVLDNL